MGIIGLTHSEEGIAIQRLPVAIKVAIGEGPDPANPSSHPKKLDHFVFKRKAVKGDKGYSETKVTWVENEEVTKVYGENCREIGVVFMDDNIENVFRTKLAWWKSTEWQCMGELVQIENGAQMQAVRKTQRAPDGEPWPGKYKYSDGDRKGQPVEPCGDGCPDLEEGRCKPSADLFFQLDKFPMFGAICRLHTTSYNSIRQLSSSLQQIAAQFGGLSGVRMMLKVRPEKGSYRDGDGKKKSTTMHILSLELNAVDWTKLLENATEMKRLFHQQRAALGAGRVIVEEDDDERAPEIAAEFHPENAELPALPPKAEIPSMEDIAKRAAIHRLCSSLGFNQAKENMLLGQYQGNLGHLEEMLGRLTAADAPAEAAGVPAAEAVEPEAPKANGNQKSAKPAAAQTTKGFDF